MYSPLKSIFCILAFWALKNSCFGQSDTTFWFAAPEVCVGNFAPALDQPIRLVISTYSSPSTITISQPANIGFAPIVANIPANSMQTFDLTAWLNSIENKPANVIHNRGLLIRSTSTITAYYEVVSPGNNPEIFPLKGHNALGTSFMIPMQNMFDNSFGYNTDPPYNSFDIVAAENNTTVTIVPSRDIVGHSAGVPFTIVLNRGQTYSAGSASNLAAEHLSGSTVVSDKPIAITVKDDLVRPFGLPCADLMGDQIVPLDKLGTEHVLVRGFLDFPPTINQEDFLFVLATQNNTSVSVNGTNMAILNQGQTYGSSFSGIAAYVQTDKPVYVIHVSGTGCEMGEALVPPVPCTGSSEVSFTRTSGQSFGLILFTTAGAENSFSINTPLSITAANFSPVPGTGGQWVAANIPCSTTEVPVGQNTRVSNSSDLFHLGIINYGLSPGGSRYGYFSDYNILDLVTQDTILICNGDSVLVQANTFMNSYQWNTGATTSSIYVSSAGYYSVTASKGGCTFTDSIYVELGSVAFDLGPDTTLCLGQSLTLNGPPNVITYQWSTGSSNPSLQVNTGGMYTLTATFSGGCTASDSIQVSFTQAVNIDLGNDTAICPQQSVLLSLTQGYDTYQWNNGSTSPTLSASQPGTYWLNVSLAGCTDSDTLELEWLPGPDIQFGADTLICWGIGEIECSCQADSYVWNTGDTTSTISVDSGGYYILTATLQSCTLTDSIYVNYENAYAFSLGPDTSVCGNQEIILHAPPNMTDYVWSNGNTTPVLAIDSPGLYWISMSSCGNTITDSIRVALRNDSYVYIPNTFTPNSDNVNDQFHIRGFSEEPIDFKLTIFDRWGEELFTTYDYLEGWNGIYRSSPCSQGVYVYVVYVNTACGGEQIFRAKILLLR